jgi:protein-tyrosine phosphatase
MFKVLFVCTGNICRSPTAEGLFLHRLRTLGLEDRLAGDSAGTIAHHAGEPPSKLAIAVARERGVDLSPLRARPLEDADFERFDLLLGMDLGHRRILAARAPATARSRLGLLLDYDGGREDGAGAREIEDPYYGAIEDYRRAYDEIARGVEGLIRRLQAKL